ncbi:MAG: hypothetical protein U1E76_05925 [Planctomycetota bacterium]
MSTVSPLELEPTAALINAKTTGVATRAPLCTPSLIGVLLQERIAGLRCRHTGMRRYRYGLAGMFRRAIERAEPGDLSWLDDLFAIPEDALAEEQPVPLLVAGVDTCCT